MPECTNCGGHVSPDFARVLSHDGEVRACPQCASGKVIRGGGVAKGPDNATQTYNSRMGATMD